MNTIQLHAIAHIVIGTAEYLIAAYFFRTNSGDSTRKLYAVFSLGVASWVTFVGLSHIVHEVLPFPQHYLPHFLTSIAFLSPVVTFGALLLFSRRFPLLTRKLNTVDYFFAWGPVIFFAPLLFFTNLIFSLRIDPVYEIFADSGKLDFLYSLFVLVYWLWSVVILANKLSKTTGYQRWLLKIFLFGILLSGVVGVMTNAILPTFFGYQQLWWLGPEASVIWLGITSYVLVKKPR